MQTIFLAFLILFKFVCAMISVYYSWKILRMRVTPTFTWFFFTLGWFALIVEMFFNYGDITNTLMLFSNPLSFPKMATQALGTTTFALFTTATVRIYYDIKAKFEHVL
jgi:hypothetical protein